MLILPRTRALRIMRYLKDNFTYKIDHQKVCLPLRWCDYDYKWQHDTSFQETCTYYPSDFERMGIPYPCTDELRHRWSPCQMPYDDYTTWIFESEIIEVPLIIYHKERPYLFMEVKLYPPQDAPDEKILDASNWVAMENSSKDILLPDAEDIHIILEDEFFDIFDAQAIIDEAYNYHYGHIIQSTNREKIA